MSALDADVVIVGAGASGLSLARRLVERSPAQGAAPSVILVERPPGPAAAERTWCFWDEPDGEYDELVTARWRRLLVRDREGRSVTGVARRPYKMLRSADFVRATAARLDGLPTVRRLTGTVTETGDLPGGGGRVDGEDTDGRPFRLTCRWIFDSRPPDRLPPARTTLLQHFRGWFLTTRRDHFDPGVAELMDFRTPQPEKGLSFAYVLPLGSREALVEYTEFSPGPRRLGEYDAALRHYLRTVRRLGDFTVTATEQGVIPMTDGVFPSRRGQSVFPLGTAAGATRPSTGYTFAAIQRQTAGVAARLRAGRAPVPPRAHSRRHRTMDAALLRALATGRVDGADLLAGLFQDNPLPRVLAFLDGRSTLREEWAIGAGVPTGPMLRSLVELPFLPRLSAPLPPAPGAPAGTAPCGRRPQPRRHPEGRTP